MRKKPAAPILFITGTDTGVGKTVFTALLLHHQRRGGQRALAMKPFCSGGLGDVRLLQSLQTGILSEAEMNPFYFHEPVAPLVARKKREIPLREVLARIRDVREQCQCLLIEGSGGLLVPLGQDYTVADLIARLDCGVIVVARNRLGTINHTLLTVRALEARGRRPLAVVLMSVAKADLSAKTNRRTLARLLPQLTLVEMPFLGARASRYTIVNEGARNLRQPLLRLAKMAGLRGWTGGVAGKLAKRGVEKPGLRSGKVRVKTGTGRELRRKLLAVSMLRIETNRLNI